MKLILAVIQGRDVDAALSRLAQLRIGATVITSTGGFLRESNSTLMIGIADEQWPVLVQTFGEVCRTRSRYLNPMPTLMEPSEFFLPQPIEVQVGGANLFVVEVERFERILRLAPAIQGRVVLSSSPIERVGGLDELSLCWHRYPNNSRERAG